LARCGTDETVIVFQSHTISTSIPNGAPKFSSNGNTWLRDPPDQAISHETTLVPLD
jgi:hypothetical protein